MTEAEWLACEKPASVVEFLRSRASSRKLRLVACAYWRWFAYCWKEDRCRIQVEVAERFADGLSSAAELGDANVAMRALLNTLPWVWRDRPGHSLRLAAQAATEADARQSVTGILLERWPVGILPEIMLPPSPIDDKRRQCQFPSHPGVSPRNAGSIRKALGIVRDATRRWWQPAENIAQIGILHDIFGNPFRTVAADPSWLAWNNGTVPALAQAIYDDRAFDRLPILADALEDAGCHNADILEHCRGGGEHARGCWVVDLVLGKG